MKAKHGKLKGSTERSIKQQIAFAKKKHGILIGCINHPWLIFRDADQNNEFMINRQNIGILNIGTLDTAIWGICLMPSVDTRKPKAICQVA